MSQRDQNHNLCKIQNLNSGILEHDYERRYADITFPCEAKEIGDVCMQAKHFFKLSK